MPGQTYDVTVRVHGTEFSRYYPPLDVIKVTASSSAAPNGTALTFTLFREDGYGVVATKAVTFNSTTATASFDLKADCFDVDGVYRARQGKYHVVGTQSDSGLTQTNSATFYILIVSVEELKKKFLRGVDLQASSNLEAQNFPFPSLTGVDIVNTASSQPKGIFTLVWGGIAAPTLAWDGGTAVTIDLTQPFLNVVLMNAKRSGYIEVSVVPDELPAGAVTENVVLDFAEIEDDVLRSFIIDAYQDIQGRLFVSLEPSTFDTDRLGDPDYDATTPFADEYADPLSYYRDTQFPLDRFLSIRFPHPWIFHRGVKRLTFYFNSSKVATISINDWLVNMTKAATGLVEFVPRVAATLIFAWFSTAGLAFLTRWPSIPSAWHYRLNAGLPDLMNDGRDRVRVAVARRAAIEALVLAGLASAPGLSAESTSRDGVSQSRTYAHGLGGRYSEAVQHHQLFLFGVNGNSGEVLKLRQRLLGLYGVTV